MVLKQQEQETASLVYYIECVLQGISTPEEAAGYIAVLKQPLADMGEEDPFYTINITLTEEALYTCLNEPNITQTLEYIQEIWKPMMLLAEPVVTDPQLDQMLTELGFPPPDV